ncbi:hypothetical protein LY474_32645 [Myxococcus stipitatus]|uniref:hypothetical protein n=1 Tax=Myxococcus stipitatus TaxID=83455 RepID=UPI001F39A711|nr:hypothetical protein [Myxococcus stipitatus]MCE9672568.1 hypothetical protein [Myxococcus stipitatus]
MKRNVRWVVLAGLCLAAVLGGCNTGSVEEIDDTPEGDSFELRLTGRGSARYEKVLLGVGRIEVTANGAAVPFRRARGTRNMDLTREDHSYLLGHFYLPTGVDEAELVVNFDDVGAYTEAGASGLINARSGAVVFKTKRVELEKRRHVVIELHLNDSLFQAQGGRVLLPETFIVH